jgi:hypothetical protein
MPDPIRVRYIDRAQAGQLKKAWHYGTFKRLFEALDTADVQINDRKTGNTRTKSIDLVQVQIAGPRGGQLWVQATKDNLTCPST